MNNEDFKVIPNLDFNDVFKKQKGIFLRFMEIENREWKLEEFDINTLEDQNLFKDFMEIRVIEELVESTLDMENWDHYLEEMVDALNFLVESYILYGWDYSDLSPWNEDIKFESDNLFECYYRVIESIGACCNLLKNRLWKESQYLVDLYKFDDFFKEVWVNFNKLCNKASIPKKLLIEVWSLKYQVNKFRIDTKY